MLRFLRLNIDVVRVPFRQAVAGLPDKDSVAMTAAFLRLFALLNPTRNAAVRDFVRPLASTARRCYHADASHRAGSLPVLCVAVGVHGPRRARDCGRAGTCAAPLSEAPANQIRALCELAHSLLGRGGRPRPDG